MPDIPPTSRQDRLERVIADYLHAVEAGQVPDRAAILMQHPELADDLGSFFRNRDAMERLAAPIKAQLPADAETIGALDSGSSNGGAGGTIIRYFGDYELLQEIARGGMGVVYKARQVSLNRMVAVKMILAGQLASQADVQRFRTEAEAAANLDHPNIVPIYEVGEHEGQHYYSMKLVEGGSLASWITDCRLQSADFQKQAAKIMVQVARAVHHAHQRGILHRDLKPGNILLQKAEGEKDDKGASDSSIIAPHSSFTSMVTDFGLAKRVEGDRALTQSGALVGTPSYMAPEQARSEKVLTTAVDVYALGAILYELLTGQPPFRAETALDTVLWVLEKEPASPRSLNGKIKLDLETICLKCLRKEPDKRYESAAALANDLERWTRGELIQARPPGTLERGIKWAKRRPALAGLVAVSLLAVITLAAVILNSNARLKDERDHALEEEQKAGIERGKALQAKTEANRQRLRAEELLSHNRVERGLRLLDLGNSLGLLDLLEARRAAEDLPHLKDARTTLWTGWEAACSGRLEMTLPASVPVTALAFHPVGKAVATRQEDGSITLWDWATGQSQWTTAAPKLWNEAKLAFALDGKTLLCRMSPKTTAVTADIQVWETAAGRAMGPPGGVGQAGEVACSSPDGRWLVTCNGNKLQKRDPVTRKAVGRPGRSRGKSIPSSSVRTASWWRLLATNLNGSMRRPARCMPPQLDRLNAIISSPRMPWYLAQMASG
jgi:hypothetical protein